MQDQLWIIEFRTRSLICFHLNPRLDLSPIRATLARKTALPSMLGPQHGIQRLKHDLIGIRTRLQTIADQLLRMLFIEPEDAPGSAPGCSIAENPRPSQSHLPAAGIPFFNQLGGCHCGGGFHAGQALVGGWTRS